MQHTGQVRLANLICGQNAGWTSYKQTTTWHSKTNTEESSAGYQQLTYTGNTCGVQDTTKEAMVFRISTIILQDSGSYIITAQ